MPPSTPQLPPARRHAPRPLLAALLALATLGAGGRCGRATPEARDARDAAVGEEAGDASEATALREALRDVTPAALAEGSALVAQARTLERRALAASGAPAGAPAGAMSAGDGGAAPGVREAPAADSARVLYLRAADVVPPLAAWLRLRAAALTADPRARAALTAAVAGDRASPAAAARTGTIEATARERAGDLTGAAAAWAGMGADAAALALRLRAGEREAVRPALVALLQGGTAGGGAALSAARVPGPDREDVRRAAHLLDSAFAPLTAGERLLVARGLVAGGGDARRAAAVYAEALAGGAGAVADRHAHATLLTRLGRWRDAAASFARVRDAADAPAALAAAAAYQHGRALLRAGDAAGARRALESAASRFPSDTSAGSARFLLADLDTDAGRDAEARAGFRRIAAEHPASSWAPVAAFRAAVIALAQGSPREAAAELDALVARWPDADERLAAEYWAGRAWAAAGDPAQARGRWAAVITRQPASYYAGLAAKRLGRPTWTPPPGGAVVGSPLAEEAARRATLLEQLGLGAEAGWERTWLTAWADSSTERLAAASAALADGARPGPSIALAGRALARGAPRTAELYRLLYPLRHAALVRREAEARRIDPAFAAALVKQESNFTADARSPVGARGLMQVMPEVGRELWRGPGPWDAALLDRPEANVPMGMRHLRAALDAWPHPAQALAAYNAGAGRVRRWRQKAGADDPELFVERIPYAETRDYVRIVLRSQGLYATLYADALGARE
jgi:soluble lytic murein transglycosylase